MLEKKLITKHIGNLDPLSIEDYLDKNGYAMFKKALSMKRIDIHNEVELSKLRGRGGAGFPTSIKLMAIAKETKKPKYLICNADEGEPGNFKDRYLMENNPHLILEGILIAAYVTVATKGYIYLRGEYEKSIHTMQTAIDAAYKKGFLGTNILNSGFEFNLEIRRGAGSYVCGEEFALLESIEGKAGRTRVKPPFPTSEGLFQLPTLINNVETFATLPTILEIGGKAYALIGTPASTGTKLISLSGNINHKGVFEIPFGVSIRKIIEELGKGVPKGRTIQMVQLGGACGPIIPESLLDMTIDFERFEQFESKTGAGAIIVIDDSYDMFEILKNISRFFAHESCGKCTPCREGNIHIMKTLDKFVQHKAKDKDLMHLENQAIVMHQTSLCGLGQTTTTSIMSSLHYFRSNYQDRIKDYAEEVL